MEYQYWKNYSQETLKTELQKIDLTSDLTGSAQQIGKKLDHVLGKVMDLLTPVLTKKVRCDKYEPSFVTAEKKELKKIFTRNLKRRNFLLSKRSADFLKEKSKK